MKNHGWDNDLADALNLAVPLRNPADGLEDKILLAVKKRRKTLRPRAFLVPGLLAATLLLAAGNLVQWTAQPAMTALKTGFKVALLNGTKAAPTASGTMILDLENNHGVLAVRHLPVLTDGAHYELWLESGGEVQSVGDFEVNPDGYGSLTLAVPAGFNIQQFFVCRGSPDGKPNRPWLLTGKL